MNNKIACLSETICLFLDERRLFFFCLVSKKVHLWMWFWKVVVNKLGNKF